jgi:glutamate carboxypeptidase
VETSQRTTARRLLDHLRRRQKDMVGLMRHLVHAESPSVVPDAQAAVQRILGESLEKLDYRVRVRPGRTSGGVLLAAPADRLRGRPRQLLLGHGDTVWPLGTLKTMPAVTRDGRFHGPGSFDMKGGLVQMIFALESLRAIDRTPEVVPLVLVNSDEEIGSGESAGTIRRLSRISDRVLVVEPALGPSGRLKTARKGVGQFTIRVVGRSAHAGLDPERGASAILELSHVVQSLFALNDPERGITVNVGTIEGGIRPNVIAPESNAVVDVRVLHQEDAAEVERAILSLEATTPGTELRATGGFNRPPMERTPGNRLLWERALEAAAELGLEIEEATAGGGSDGNLTSPLAPTLDGIGAVGDGAHAPHEHVIIEKMVERAALLARLLLDPPLAESG